MIFWRIFVVLWFFFKQSETARKLRGNWTDYCDIFKEGKDPKKPVGCLRAKPFYVELPAAPHVKSCNLYANVPRYEFKNVTVTTCANPNCTSHSKLVPKLVWPDDIATRRIGDDVGCLNSTHIQCTCKYCDISRVCLARKEYERAFAFKFNFSERCPRWYPLRVGPARCSLRCRIGHIRSEDLSTKKEPQCESCGIEQCRMCRKDKISRKITCLECIHPFRRIFDTITGKHKCVEQCPSGFGVRAADHFECVPCKDPHCTRCELRFDICEKCEENYLDIGGGKCGTKCVAGTFKKVVGTQRFCLACPEECSECSAWRKCTKCHSPYVLKLLNAVGVGVDVECRLPDGKAAKGNGTCHPLCSHSVGSPSSAPACYGNNSNFECVDCKHFTLEIRLEKFCLLNCPLGFRATHDRSCIPVPSMDDEDENGVKMSKNRVHYSTTAHAVTYSLAAVNLIGGLITVGVSLRRGARAMEALPGP